ncbi:hypothetical protein [Phenylobacterium sp.]|uniref:hypothetical protein n=1 Tax=Phenylobacterium sp. TaxID=1871053 RepID=UPI002C9E394B|nr:hypothetical protein [Phenylobacterium sp.]HLZ76022.1 hypothetical protein [Phenylobacterium sp.]
MASLDIRPHSPRISGWAVAGLMLLGAGAFGAGVVHQLTPAGALPFPPQQDASLKIAVATPAADVAPPVDPPKHRDAPPAADAAPGLALQVAQTAPGADAASTAPEPAAAPPAPEPQTPQTPAPGDADPPT